MVLEELMKDYLDVSALRKVQVQYAAMFNEEWSTPYEVCWQANGADSRREYGVRCDQPSRGNSRVNGGFHENILYQQ